MSTTTDLSTLVINYLTEAQYEAAVSGGTIDPDQLYLTPETNIPVTDVEVNGTSVVSSGVAEVTVPTKVSDLTNDSGYITGYTETDPTVPSWAKASSKPSYTAAEVGAVPTSRTVNGKALSSNITLSASDVSALPSSTVIPAITDTYSGTSSNGMSGKAVKSAIDALDGSVSGSAGSGKTLTAFSQTNGVVSATFGSISITKSQVSDFPSIPSKTSDLQNDSGFITLADVPEEIFVATYGTTSYADALTAYNGGKALFCKYNNGIFPLCGYTNSIFRFSNIDGSGTQQFTLSSSGWTRQDATVVLNTRTVNGKALSSDITLTASDVGAVASETDPVFTASAAYGISSTDISEWDNAYDGNISFDTTAASGDDYNLKTILTTLGWLNDVIV